MGSSAGINTSSPVAGGKATGIGETLPLSRWRSWVAALLAGKRSLHQSATSLIDQSIVSATNFLTGVIIARSCSKAELGLYMLGFSLILLITDLQSTLISTPYMIYAPRLKGSAQALYTGSTLVHQLAFSLVTTLFVVGGALLTTMGIGPLGLGPVLWALVAVSSLIMLREFVRRVCFATLRLVTALILDFSISIAQISALLFLARSHSLSASRAYWTIGAVSGVGVFWWLGSNKNFYQPKIDESLGDLKKNWLLGKWIFASGLLWAISMNLYPWLLAFFHGAASAGVWAACLGVVAVGNPVLLGIQNLVGPKIAHVCAADGPVALRRFVVKMTAMIAAPISLFCLMMAIWGDRLVTLLYGHQYGGNKLVVAVLAFNLLITVATFTFSRALFSIERAHVDFVVNFAALFIMVTLGLWLVRAYGPVGAAIGMVGANLVTVVARAATFLTLSQSVPEPGDPAE